MFEPEQPRGLTAGLDAELVEKLIAWEGRAAAPGQRRLNRAEVKFRGQAKLVAEFYAVDPQRGLIVMRAMADEWQDAVRNGFGIALGAEKFGLDPLVSCRPSLELWLRWQETERI